MRKDGKLYPLAFLGSNNTKEDIYYIKNQLDDRIISYFFVNDTLENKSIYVYSVDKTKKTLQILQQKKIL